MLLVSGAPSVFAEPDDPATEAGPPEASGPVPSAPPAVTTFADGWTLAVSATRETQLTGFAAHYSRQKLA